MRTLLRLPIVFAVLVTGGFVHADRDDDEKQLRDLELLVCAMALVNADVKWIDSFYDKDWLLVGSDNSRTNRQQYLAPLANGRLQWVQCAFSEIEVRVFGDVAIVMYKAAALGVVNGAKIDETGILHRHFHLGRIHAWRCVHSHNCPVAQ